MPPPTAGAAASGPQAGLAVPFKGKCIAMRRDLTPTAQGAGAPGCRTAGGRAGPGRNLPPVAVPPGVKRFLRIAIFVAAAIGTAFWFGTAARVMAMPIGHRDGLEIIGVILATAYFLGLVLPILVLAIIGRCLIVGALLAAIVIGLAADTIWPWFPWSLFQSN